MADITGTNGEDSLQGTNGGDVIDGRGGNDHLYGLGGDDQLKGGAGNDYLDGGLGADTVRGGEDNDQIIDTLGGDDRLFGEAGNDYISIERVSQSASGVVKADGGAGEDQFYFSGHNANGVRATLLGGAGEDYMDAYQASNVTLDGGSDDDSLNVRWSTNAVVKAGSGNDEVSITYARGGSFVADLGDGDDTLSIGVYSAYNSNYRLTLGEGQDTLVLTNLSNVAIPNIRITDFEAGVLGDRLDLSAYLTSVMTGWDGGNPFGSGRLQLVQSGDDTLLQIDTDGGADNWQTLIAFDDILASSFTAENLNGFHRVGSR